mgnify:CR=1 FL=1
MRKIIFGVGIVLIIGVGIFFVFQDRTVNIEDEISQEDEKKESVSSRERLLLEDIQKILDSDIVLKREFTNFKEIARGNNSIDKSKNKNQGKN